MFEKMTPLSESGKAAVKAEADQLLAQIRTAADPLAEFDKVMNERSEDGRDENNQLYAPDGYLAYAGQMVPQLESAAKALAVGEISEPVETNYGYHIILRQDFTDEERQQLRDSMAAIYPDYAMSKLNEQWVEEAKVEVKPAYEKLDPNSFYKNMVAFAEQWQEEKAAEEAIPLKEGYAAAMAAQNTSYACVEKNIRSMVGKLQAGACGEYQALMGGLPAERPSNELFLRRLARRILEW